MSPAAHPLWPPFDTGEASLPAAPAEWGRDGSPAGECAWPLCVVVGLGNSLLADEGIGVHAVRRLRERPPPGALVLEVGTDLFSAIPWLEKAPRVLAIDAMDAGREPGTIYQCGGGEVDMATVRTSLHELGFLATLEFVARNRRPEVHILGIQPATVGWSLELSPILRAALPGVVEAARAIVAAWARPPGPAVEPSWGQASVPRPCAV
jgi:hydrogenase maturation protease